MATEIETCTRTQTCTHTHTRARVAINTCTREKTTNASKHDILRPRHATYIAREQGDGNIARVCLKRLHHSEVPSPPDISDI